MNDQGETSEPPQPSQSRRSWSRFGLRTLLLFVLMVAVFLGGRNSNRWRESGLEGKWELTLPRGFKKPANIVRNPDGLFVISTGGVLSGIYEWRDGQLIVVQPSDERMMGLTWARHGQQLQLVSEPQGTPTGSSYLGAVLEPVAEQKMQSSKNEVEGDEGEGVAVGRR